MKRYLIVMLFFLVVCLPAYNQAQAESAVGQAITKVADRLVADRIMDAGDDLYGYWSDDPDDQEDQEDYVQYYGGTIVAGLARAYQVTGKPIYKTAAELGGEKFCRDVSVSIDFYSNEVFALLQLSEISTNPDDNIWRDKLEDYFWIVENWPGGTQGYISEQGFFVFELSHLVQGAFYVNSVDKDLWRDSLFNTLLYLDDIGSDIPVFEYACGIWSLSQTGPVDELLLEYLETHQVDSGDYAGSFYYRFDHQGGSGYTEDTILAVQGMIAAERFVGTYDFSQSIELAEQVLLDSIGLDGQVYFQLFGGDTEYEYYHFAGEMLSVLADLVPLGDSDLDGSVNSIDLTELADSWLSNQCRGSYCGDFNGDQKVDILDLAALAANWVL